MLEQLLYNKVMYGRPLDGLSENYGTSKKDKAIKNTDKEAPLEKKHRSNMSFVELGISLAGTIGFFAAPVMALQTNGLGLAPMLGAGGALVASPIIGFVAGMAVGGVMEAAYEYMKDKTIDDQKNELEKNNLNKEKNSIIDDVKNSPLEKQNIDMSSIVANIKTMKQNNDISINNNLDMSQKKNKF